MDTHVEDIRKFEADMQRHVRNAAIHEAHSLGFRAGIEAAANYVGAQHGKNSNLWARGIRAIPDPQETRMQSPKQKAE